MKIALVGAGSAQFGCGTLGDIFSSKALAGCEIALQDINPGTLGETLKTAREFASAHSLANGLTATTDRREAFRGADFIISSIEVGNRFKLWDEDWKVPLQYGAPQVYGENGGPGGIFHALRTVPPILDIVRDAMELCPEAWIFNFSNPMTAICTTVSRAFPQAKFVGLCHEIGWLSRCLPGILGMALDEIMFRAAGLNHFSCALEIKNRRDGRDLYPEVLAKAPSFFARFTGYSDLFDDYRATGKMDAVESFGKGEAIGESRYEWADRKLVRFMLENYGLLPITTDSHFGEYLGWAHDVVDHRGILDFYRFLQSHAHPGGTPRDRPHGRGAGRPHYRGNNRGSRLRGGGRESPQRRPPPGPALMDRGGGPRRRVRGGNRGHSHEGCAQGLPGAS